MNGQMSFFKTKT